MSLQVACSGMLRVAVEKLEIVRGNDGIHAQLERLGLQTYNEAREGVTTRAIFKYQPVIRLYKLEAPSLFGILERDGLDRDGPMLFDEELDVLLQKYGPLIRPRPGEASREYLREAQAGTLYETDLVYPCDTAMLFKQNPWNWSPMTDALRVLGTRSISTTATPKKTLLASGTNTLSQRHGSFDDCFDEEDSATGSETEGSVIGTTTRRRAFREITSSQNSFTKVELRLYRKLTVTLPGGYGPVHPYGPMFLTPDCTTAQSCFKRICDKIKTDCSFMVFQLPEDMEGVIGGVRVDRGSSDAETTFQHVLEIFCRAKKFPGEPQYRSVEVEVGLDMPEDD
ncbi:hypothetical protein CC86DRAFT_413360 [Ophiobolus disseminans]|uniref:Uncharacterized protein n=1 Tax=Ophiobolus disseminans TaxID=1469910 RepID=A0A6A6ZCZ7_9PLEO|nr:hypothetical protein CC86DRAFT_413360 [Ophiobolus disseminans]